MGIKVYTTGYKYSLSNAHFRQMLHRLPGEMAEKAIRFRPYLPGIPDFNISHSGHQVICAVAPQGRVGTDLEMIKEVNIEEFSSLFAPDRKSPFCNIAGFRKTRIKIEYSCELKFLFFG